MAKKIPDRARGERFRYLREDVLGIESQGEFAKEIGVKRGAVGNWELGFGCKADNMKKIALRYRISFDWLAYGRGEPPVVGDVIPGRRYVPADEEDQPPESMSDKAYSRENYVSKIPGGIPELDLGLGGGEGRVGEFLAVHLNGENYVGHRVVTEWVLPEPFVRTEARASFPNAVVLPVTGDSMFPSYSLGDRVLVDLSQNAFVDDAVYAISDGNSEPRIKRLHLVFNSSPKRVRIISDNPIYPQEEHVAADVVVIGRVCGIIARR